MNHGDQSVSKNQHFPVLLFFPGGAWMIGYKMWAALTARVLAQFNIVTVVADYRNRLPGFGDDVRMPHMVNDVTAAIEWTFKNIHRYGGDASRIVVAGQSAGGHLATTAILKRTLEMQLRTNHKAVESLSSSRTTTTISEYNWKPTDLKGLISVSAPYHFPQMRKTFLKHGLSDQVIDSLFGPYCQDDYDPLRLVQLQQQERHGQGLLPLLPPIQVWHGAQDATVPSECAEEFASALQKSSSNVKFCRFENWTHTDGILEGPLSGDHEFHRHLAFTINELVAAGKKQDDQEQSVTEWSNDHSILDPLWTTRWMAKVGIFCNPF